MRGILDYLETLVQALRISCDDENTLNIIETMLNLIEASRLQNDSSGNPIVSSRANLTAMFSELKKWIRGDTPAENKIALLIGKSLRKMGEFDSAIEWFDGLINRGEEIDQNILADALKQKGHVYSFRSQWRMAEECYSESLRYHRRTLNRREIADTYNNLGYNACQQGMLAYANEMHMKALEIAEDLNDPILRSDAHNSLGVIASMRCDWDSAVEHFLTSIEEYSRINDAYGLAQTYQNLAMVYADCERWREAGEAYEIASEMARRHGDLTLLATIYINRAELLVDISDIPAALAYCGHALSLFMDMGDDSGVAEAYKLLGRIQRKQSEFDRAFSYLEKSLDLFQSCNNPQGMAETCYELGVTHMENEDVASAIVRFETSKRLFSQIGAVDEVVKVEEALAACA